MISVSRVEEIMLLMMVMVSGWLVSELVPRFRVVGKRVRMMVVEVISMGCMWIGYVLVSVVSMFMLLLWCWVGIVTGKQIGRAHV